MAATDRIAPSMGWSAFTKATDLKKRLWFTLGALIVYRLGTYIPIPGIDQQIFADIFAQINQSGGLLTVLSTFSGRRARAHDDLCAQHHAVYLGGDYHPASDRRVAEAGSAQERRRIGPQEDQPVYPLPHGAAGGCPGLRRCGQPGRRQFERRQRRRQSRHVLPGNRRHYAGRRNDLPHVAGRADYGARRRQRYFAHHLCRHRCQRPGRDGPAVRDGPPRLAVRFRNHRFSCHGETGRRLRGVHGAGAAKNCRPVSQTAAGQPADRRRAIAYSAEAQHRRRDSADLCKFPVASPGNDFGVFRGRAGRNG